MIGFPLQLPIEATTPRRWWVGESSGDTFAEGDDFDGLTPTIELFSHAEAQAVAQFLWGLQAHAAQPKPLPQP